MDKTTQLEIFEANKARALSNAEKRLNTLTELVAQTTANFFQIGFELNELNHYHYLHELGYEKIEDLAEDKFGFGRSTTYGMIKVYQMFRVRWGSNVMMEGYSDYSYTKLLEMAKMDCVVETMKKRVKPTDSVRDIQGYARFFNKYARSHSCYPSQTLEEWKAQEEIKNMPVTPMITNAPVLDFKEEIDEVEEAVGSVNVSEEPEAEERDFETETVEAEPETEEEEESQSKRLDCAPAPTEEKPKYNLSSRDGVRAFLDDYENWEAKYLFSHIYFGARFWRLGKKCIYAIRFKTCDQVTGSFLYSAKVRYFLCLEQADFDVSQPTTFIEMSRRQLEQYFAEQKECEANSRQ